MREFASRSALRRLDAGGRLVYTCFLVFLLGGIVSIGLLHVDGMGTGAESATTYWRGDEAGMAYPKSYRQILELTHFHLFVEPLAFLVVAHLYNLGSAPVAQRVLVTGALVAAIAAQIGLPWLVSFGSASFAVALLPTHAILVLGLAYMGVATLWEMWTPSS